MEYDRNQNPYSASSPAGDYYRYRLPDKANPTGHIEAGWLTSANKAEIDCLMCHLHDNSVISGNGLAFLQSMGCSGSNQIGPDNDPSCATPPTATNSVTGLNGAGWNSAFAGAKYDMYNRALAIKAKQFNYAASLGMGAKAVGLAAAADGTLQMTGITGVPATIASANIQGTPNSQNCSVCHARDDNTPGLVGMHHMRMGYGGYELITLAGAGYDSETGTNATRWLELGCKTGMGKRAHRIGHGPNDKYNDSKIVSIFGLGKTPGTTIATETLTVPAGRPLAGETIQTVERIPDQDVHDAGSMQCATCHYTLGSTSLEGGSKTIPATVYQDVLPLSEGTIVFPQKTYQGIDHQFAKFGTMEDTNAMPNINGSVSCESCHITRDHPRVVSGEINPPVPTHAGFPSLHFQKISCTTCHIPEVYAAPGRLKYRDFSLGYYKKFSDASGGWRNMLDWNWDFISWGAKPVPPLHVWATRNGKTQIVPVLPSTIPAWEEANTNAATEAQSDTAVAGKTGQCNADSGVNAGAACSSDADCGIGTCNKPDLAMTDNQFFVANPGMGLTPGPVKARDTSAVALAVENGSTVLRRGTNGKGELNGAQLVPLFDGFPLADSWGVDTKARIDAMYAAGAGSEMRVYQAARFDVTHGVVPKEWALGGSKRGGCISCHSSVDQWQRDARTGRYIKDAAGNPSPNPNYSPNSVGFFEGFQQPFVGPTQMFNNFPGPGQYDLIKNWFALFAGFDCTAMTNGMHMTQAACYNMCTNNMNMPNASCQQFCPNANACGNPGNIGCSTSNTAYAALYQCDDSFDASGNWLGPDMATCGVNGHLGQAPGMGFNNPSLDTGYYPGYTDANYYDAASGMPKSTAVVGLQYQCGSFAMTGGDCSAPGVAAECAMSGAPGDMCTSNVNPNWNKGIMPNGRIYANYIMPCWDAQTNPTCSGSSMMNGNYKSEAYDPFLAACSGFMTTGFDNLMYYPAGTSQALGWFDGLDALRLLTIKETVSGKTEGCDPYGAAFDPTHAGLLNCVPGSVAGTCTDVGGGMKMCMGGAAAYMSCSTDADCTGKSTVGNLLWTRADMRDHFLIQLQQSCGGSYNPDGSVSNACTGNEANPLVPGGITYANARLTWPIGSERNPGNPAHLPAWDQAGKLNVCGAFQDQPCCTNQMGVPETCKDGSYVKTTIHENQLLGYTSDQWTKLVSMFSSGTTAVSSTPNAPTARLSYKVTGLTVDADASASLGAVSYSWDFGDGTTATGATASHMYGSAGTKTVTLTVTGSTGFTNTKIVKVNVAAVNGAPTAAGNCSVSGSSLTINSTSTDPDNDPLTLFVNWGDGNGGTLASGVTSTTHTYAVVGIYVPYLAASDHRGGSDSQAVCGSVNISAHLGTILGVVSTPSGTHLGTALVSLMNGASVVEQTYTDGSGTYTMVNVPFGTGYSVRTQLSGYLFADVTPVNVPDATPVVENVVSGESTVSGAITNAPAQGIAVELRYGNGATAAVTICDGSGNYSFTNVAAGTFDVVPQCTTGHATAPVSVSVTVPATGTVAAGGMTYN